MSEALKQAIQTIAREHVDALNHTFEVHTQDIIELSQKLAACFEAGNKLLLCGNGGSATDALHMAGECVGRFVKDRKALPAMALSADPGILTAVGNDYGFEHVFARQIEAHGNKGDVLIAISTSGTSKNIVKAIETAQACGIYTVLLTGIKGKGVKADKVIAVASERTARIQEVHITLLQTLIELVERKLFPALFQ